MAIAETLIQHLIFIFTALVIPDGSSAYVDYIENGKLVETVLVESQDNMFVISQETQKLGLVEKLKSGGNKYFWKDNKGSTALITSTDSIKFENDEKLAVMIGKQNYRFQKTNSAFYLFGENGTQFVIRIK